MPKKQTADPFDPATRARLLAVGRYEVVTDPGYCEIHFGAVPALAGDLAAFDLSWFLHGKGKTVPAPGDALFALWDRYRIAHAGMCSEYRRRLFALFARSAQAKYDDRQWKLLRRTKPTEADLSSVLTHGTVSLCPTDDAAGYEVQVSFVVFWDEHGVAMRLREAGGVFSVADVGAIGDL